MVMSSKPIAATDHSCCHCGAAGAFGYWRSGARDSVMRWFCAEHRQGVWYADACCSEVDANRAHADLRPLSSDPPDLQALVAEHGGYNKIPSKAWVEFDRAMAAWQLRRRGAVR
jgi:hypothetical protein